MGVDLLYQKLETSFVGVATYAANAPRPSSGPLYKIEDQDALSFTFRVHRDIVLDRVNRDLDGGLCLLDQCFSG
jgi:hypothetical protein